MGQVECISVPGLRLWFNSLDHGPPHFHALRPGEWEIRVFFRTSTDECLCYELKWRKRRAPTAGQLDQLRVLVARNRAALYEEWERKVSDGGA